MSETAVRPKGVIDLNADVGEAEDDAGVATELALFRTVTTVHVACGGHAGDFDSMRRMVYAANQNGVALGAHPSYPDREGFGRRPMRMRFSELAESVAAQVRALRRVAEPRGVNVVSVKPHGALYNEAAKNPMCTMAIVAGVQRAFGEAHVPPLVLMAGTVAQKVVGELQLSVLAEAFCDRGYEQDGTLTERNTEGALITDPETAARRAVELVARHGVTSRQGGWLPVLPDTLCVHGDTPGAVDLAQRVRRALEAAQITVAAPSTSTW